jgi:ubiquinone/menaquinone biosynthesis C-methylase UbiE
MKKDVLEHYNSIADDFTDLSNKYCNSRYRREIERYVKQDFSVLEVGCGTGLLLSMIDAKRKIGCDFSEGLLRQLKKKGLALVSADAEALPFKDGSFELVYSVNLLEHVADPGKAISECLRVLRKGGKAVLITPNGDMGLFLEIADRLKLKAPEGPHKFLTSRMLERIIKNQNLRVAKRGKFVILPSGPGFMLRSFEKIEKFLPSLGFFHLVVLEKR